MIRKAIGYVIHDRTPQPKDLPDTYLRFAEALSVHDTVLTLNYDLVLENALESVGKPFRRYPYRYKSIGQHGGTLDSDTEEVVLLKLHGSVDWFDDRPFLELKNSLEHQGIVDRSLHSVFDDPTRYAAKRLVDGLLPDGDTLRHLHSIQHVDDYYYGDRGFNAPFLLSPSHVKFVYAEPILSFWHGIGRSGGYNLGVSVVGFSLPQHDEYIRIGLYQMLSNYGSWWKEPMFEGMLKDYARFVDFRPTSALQEEYRQRYRFAEADRSRFHFGGFGPEAIDFLFNQRRDV
jgi:SIR2-like domain